MGYFWKVKGLGLLGVGSLGGPHMGDGEMGCPSVVRSVFGLVQTCGGIGTCKNTTGL